MKSSTLEKDALVTDLWDYYLEMVTLINDYGFEYNDIDIDEDEIEECVDDPEICRLKQIMADFRKMLQDNM